VLYFAHPEGWEALKMKTLYTPFCEIEQMALTSNKTEIEAWASAHVPQVFQPGLAHLALEEYFWPILQNQKSDPNLKWLALTVIRQTFLSGQSIFTTEGLHTYLRRFYDCLMDNLEIRQDVILTVVTMREQVFSRRDARLAAKYRQITEYDQVIYGAAIL